MKKLLLTLAVLVGTFGWAIAQEVVEFDATLPPNDPAGILGYANVFEIPANGGGFVFGSAWGVEDLKTELNAGNNTVTLKPNFNTWDPADPFWVNPDGTANKVFEGSTYIEDNSLIGSVVTFEGNCVSNTIDPSYQVKAFIRVLDASFNVKEEASALVAGQNFSITYDDVEPADTFFQYGFAVIGLVADPALEPTLGSVVTGAPVLGVNDANTAQVSLTPNPTDGLVNVMSPAQINSITVYNVLGQQLISQAVNATSAELDLSSFQSGIYLAEIAGENGNNIIRIMKR